MAGVQELPSELSRPALRRCGPGHFVALLGASVVVFSVVGKPPVHAGYALAGFLLWLLGVARLLLFGQIRLQCPVFPGALEVATAKLAVGKMHYFFFARRAPTPEPAAAPPV